MPGFLAQFGDPVIVAGDLNVAESGHRPRLPGFGAWEYALYLSFLVAGLTDAYRAGQPAGLDHSRLGRSGAGCRIDHVFITRQHTIQIRGCGYVQAPRRQGLTDHAALTLTLALASAATGALR
jgi:exodeoxyribonuclease III